MKFKDVKIGSQLRIGLGIILLLIVLIGVIAWLQTDQIAATAADLYDHPLQVRRAIGKLKADVLEIRLGMRELVAVTPLSEAQTTEIIRDIETCQSDAFDQLAILAGQYLGPQSDVVLTKQEFIKWNAARDETIRLLREGNLAEARARTVFGGAGRIQAQALIDALEKISAFALSKGDELFAQSQSLKARLNQHLLFLVTAILLLTLVIHYFLLRNIRRPLGALTRATQAFQSGDLAARSTYALRNEFGELSDSFNHMAETVQVEMESKAAVAGLAAVMPGFNEAKEFFQATLPVLAEKSGSQMAAVYLLSRDRKTFEHFASIGLDAGGRASFGADDFDGEFGAALASKKIQHIANIPVDTRFTFATVGGTFTPREIITLPITANDVTVAIVSLATIAGYSQPNLRFVNEIWQILNARVVGILAFRQIQALVENLEQQNSELDAQKKELSMQKDELSEAVAELDMQKWELDSANRLKSAFLSNMSHELRTPLNSVIALTGVLSRHLHGAVSDENYSYLEVIERNGRNLLALINDILDLSRIEAGREEISLSEFSFSAPVGEIVEMILPQAQEKGIALLNHVGNDLPMIKSDLAKCRHILQNLVGNAVKFTESGSVKLSAFVADEKLHFVVSDTGIGIAADQLPHIFDEFRQGDDSASRKYGGTGLGLSIAQKYAAMLQGRITVKSELGKGSIFTLCLPLTINLPETGPQPHKGVIHFTHSRPVAKTPVSGQSRRILLVEDNSSAVIQITDILSGQGYRVQTAGNGREALEQIEKEMPDAVILDLMMPEVDGFQALKMIRSVEKTAHLPVLILTAKDVTREELGFLKGNHIHQLIQKGDINRNDLLSEVAEMVSPTPHEPAAPPKKRADRRKSAQPVILIVEDNPDNLLTARALLQDSYAVIEAVDGSAAVELAKKHAPDLILMDLSLPVMDGFQAFDAIRKDDALSHIPIIALTASAMMGNQEEVIAYGFDGYISKPIERQVLETTIREKLRNEN